MKILLVACNAKYIHSNLAVYDLQAYASDYADHIVLKEYTINQQKDDIMRDIYLEHPDVVCVSCYIWNLSFVKELMADLIKILPGADFWPADPVCDLPGVIPFLSWCWCICTASKPWIYGNRRIKRYVYIHLQTDRSVCSPQCNDSCI